MHDRTLDGRVIDQGRTERPPAKVAAPLVIAHTVAAFAGLVIAALFGLLVSIKFNAPEFLSKHAWTTWADCATTTPRASSTPGWATHSLRSCTTLCPT